MNNVLGYAPTREVELCGWMLCIHAVQPVRAEHAPYGVQNLMMPRRRSSRATFRTSMISGV
jgi:hypothetical protein